MLVYLLVFLTIIFFGWWYERGKKEGRRKLIYCVICAVAMFLPLALKKPEVVGSDLQSLYMPNFEKVQEMNFGEIFHEYHDTEKLYYVFSKVVSVFTQNSAIFLAICALPLILAITFLIYKKSKMPMLSFLMFMGLHYYALSFIIVRHSLALALVIMAFYYLWEKKYVKSVVWWLLAVCFHRTALIFGVAYLLRFIKYRWWYVFVPLVAGILIFIFKEQVFDLIFSVINSGHFAAYERAISPMGINAPIILYLLISVACAVLYRRKEGKVKKETVAKFKQKRAELIEKTEEDLGFPMNLSLMGATVTSGMTVIVESLRLGMFLTIPNVILLPNLILKVKNRYARVTAIVAIAGFMVFYGIRRLAELNLLEVF